MRSKHYGNEVSWTWTAAKRHIEALSSRLKALEKVTKQQLEPIAPWLYIEFVKPQEFRERLGITKSAYNKLLAAGRLPVLQLSPHIHRVCVTPLIRKIYENEQRVLERISDDDNDRSAPSRLSAKRRSLDEAARGEPGEDG